MTDKLRLHIENGPKLQALEERREKIKKSFSSIDLLNPVTKRSIVLALSNIKREKARL